MTKKKEETKIEEENTKKELPEEYIEELKDNLTRELNDYIDRKITLAVSKEIEKTNKKIIRAKTRKIIFRDIIIILLLALCIYFAYLLKNAHYFDKYFIDDNNKQTEEITPKTDIINPTNEKPKEPTLDELTKEYGSLLNNLYLNEKSEYIKNLYTYEFTPEVKQYFTMNYIISDGLIIDDNYNVIENAKFKTAYETIFNDAYVPTSFEYNDNNIRYISKLESYITDKLVTENKTNIIKEIIDIKVTDYEIIITTIEGILINNKVYEIINDKEICEVTSMKENASKLNKLVYTFNKDKKLIKITK